MQLFSHTRAAIFTAIAFGLALVLACLGGGALTFYMFTPLVATLVILPRGVRGKFSPRLSSRLGLRSPGLKYWPLALLAPAGVLVNSYAIVWGLGIAQPNLPADAAAWLSLALDNGLGLILMMVFAFGEEIGWRGYLLPCFSGLGARRSLLLVGFIHGLWHLPVMLLTSAYHAAGSPLITVPLFIATLTLAGVYYGYLRLRSGSIWPVVLAHATFNQVWMTLEQMTTSAAPLTTEYLAGESGLLTLLAVSVIARELLRRLAIRPQLTW